MNQKEFQHFLKAFQQLSEQEQSQPEEVLKLYNQNILNAESADTSEAFFDLFNKFKVLNEEYSKLKGSSSKAPKLNIGIGNLVNVTKAVIKIQAWWRKELQLSKLRDGRQLASLTIDYDNQQMSGEEKAIREFVKQLSNKKITPESFFRMCDFSYSYSIEVDHFQQMLVNTGIKLSGAQFKRLIMVLDEDMEGHISSQEYIDALEAYTLSTEPHNSSVSSRPYLHQCLASLIKELKAKNVSSQEMFNACDTNDDGRVQMTELKNFLTHLSAHIKLKELHVIMNFLDIDKNGIIEQDDFLRLMRKAEQISQNMLFDRGTPNKRSNNPFEDNTSPIQTSIKNNNFFEEQEIEAGDQSFLRDTQEDLFSQPASKSRAQSKGISISQGGNRNSSQQGIRRQPNNVLAKIIPDIGLLSPDQICQEVMKYMTKELAKKRLRPLNIYKMADSKNAGSVQPITIEQAFQKMLPDISKDIITETVKLIPKQGARNLIMRQDFENIFNEQNQQTIVPENSRQVNVVQVKSQIEQPPKKQTIQQTIQPQIQPVQQVVVPKQPVKKADPPQQILVQQKAEPEGAPKLEGLAGIIQQLEVQLKMPLEYALEDLFSQQAITVLDFQRKMQTLSNNTADRKLVAQLCKEFDKQVKGRILITDIFKVLMANGKNNINVNFNLLAHDTKDPVESFLMMQGCAPGMTLEPLHFRDILLKFSKISLYDVFCLFYDMNNYQEELESNIFIDKIKELKKNIKTPQQSPMMKKQGTLTSKAFSSKNNSAITQILQQFIDNFDILWNETLIHSALDKFSAILKKFKTDDAAVTRFDPESFGAITIDQLKKSIDQQQGLTDDEKLILTILPMEQENPDITVIDIELYIQTLRNQPTNKALVAKNKGLLKHIKPTIESVLPKKVEAPKSSPVIKKNILGHSITKNLAPTIQQVKRKKVKRIIEQLEQGLKDKEFKEKMKQLFLSSPGQSVILYLYYEFIEQLGTIEATSPEDEASLIEEYLQILLLILFREFEQFVDPEFNGHIHLFYFEKFCDDCAIDFKTGQAIPIEQQNDENDISGALGEHLTCERLHYVIDPDRDYHQGNPTILNSEKAALVVAQKIYDSLPKDGKYLDTEFGPKDEASKDKEGSVKALYYTPEEKLSKMGFTDPDDIVWIRPEKFGINPDDPEADQKFGFVLDGTSSNDVKQGKMGNCWFIGALSVLATRDDLLRGEIANIDMSRKNKDFKADAKIADDFSNGVYPPLFHMYRQKRIYVMKFFRDFSWKYVIIDDRVPCNIQTEKPIFASCRDLRELWVPLIEKAYAKLNGCYEVTASGYIDDALNELTGLVTEKLVLQDTVDGKGVFPSKKIGDKEKFWQKLLKFKKSQSMMGCSIAGATEGHIKDEDGRPVGILSGHAYGIIDIFELPDPDMENARKTHRLLRVRNPWGTLEWNGKWSDNSEEVLELYKEKLEDYVKNLKDEDERWKLTDDDGTFLINYQSWRDIYNKMFICIDLPSFWTAIRYETCWDATCSGGIPTKMTTELLKRWAENPQFLLTAKKDIEIFISLAQPEGRGKKDKDGQYLKYPFTEVLRTVNFVVMELSEDQEKAEMFDKTKVKGSSPLMRGKEVSMRFHLPKGKYIIVPACANAGDTGPFYLSLYYNLLMKDAYVKRVDKPELDKYHFILEETEHFEGVQDWKMDLCQKRHQYAINARNDEEVFDSSASQIK